jgi:cytochrome c oxidase assembly factor CtaG
VRRPGRRWWLGTGLVVAAVVLSPPVESWVDTALPAHMVQHVLLTMVAAPLLAAGLPWPWERKVHPVPAWLLFAATGWLIHFTGFFEAAAGHAPVHVAEHLLLAGTAVLFWSQVVGPAARMSHPLRLVYLVVAMPQNTFLALAIFSAGHVLYPHYAGGGDPLGEQRLAGGIMWVAGDLVLLAAVLLVAAGWARHEEQENLATEGAGRAPSPRTAG